MQAYGESHAGYEPSRNSRLIAMIFDDKQVRRARALKHLVEIACGERLQQFVFYDWQLVGRGHGLLYADTPSLACSSRPGVSMRALPLDIIGK